MDNLMDLRYLAQYYNGILGDKYKVLVNGKIYPSDDEKITVVSLHAHRMPMPVNGVRSETLNVTLKFWLIARKKEEVLADMQRLLGTAQYDIVTENATYRINSYIEQEIPFGNPAADTGEYMADYQASGTVLVSDKADGTVMSNDIAVKLNGVPLAVLSCQTQMDKSVETPVLLNAQRVNPLPLSQGAKYTILALHMGRALDYELSSDIELAASGNLSKTYTLRREFPNGTAIQKTCLLVGGMLTENAGAYAQYTVVLQEV